jgi:hypothetical protein
MLIEVEGKFTSTSFPRGCEALVKVGVGHFFARQFQWKQGLAVGLSWREKEGVQVRKEGRK